MYIRVYTTLKFILILQYTLAIPCFQKSYYNDASVQNKLNGMLFIVCTAQNNGFRIFECSQSAIYACTLPVTIFSQY